jgi:hypothetical protein
VVLSRPLVLKKWNKVKMCISFVSLLVILWAILIFILVCFASAAFKSSTLVYEICTVEFGTDGTRGSHD